VIDFICAISFLFSNLGMRSVYVKETKSSVEVTAYVCSSMWFPKNQVCGYSV